MRAARSRFNTRDDVGIVGYLDPFHVRRNWRRYTGHPLDHRFAHLAAARLQSPPHDARIGNDFDNHELRYTRGQRGDRIPRAVRDHMPALREIVSELDRQCVVQAVRRPGEQKRAVRLAARKLVRADYVVILTACVSRTRDHAPREHEIRRSGQRGARTVEQGVLTYPALTDDQKQRARHRSTNPVRPARCRPPARLG
jgi:hypothetical protein